MFIFYDTIFSIFYFKVWKKKTLFLLLSESRCSSVKSETPPSTTTSNGALIGAASGAGAGVALILVVIIAVICRNRNKANRENTDYLTPVNDNAGYARADEIRCLGEMENAHPLNQYAGMGNSGDGSISARSAQKSP